MLVIHMMDEPLRLSGSEKGNLVAGAADGHKGQSVVDDLKQFLPVYDLTMDSTLERFSI
ncbi:unnamed protein product, partial [Musa textilis]